MQFNGAGLRLQHAVCQRVLDGMPPTYVTAAAAAGTAASVAGPAAGAADVYDAGGGRTVVGNFRHGSNLLRPGYLRVVCAAASSGLLLPPAAASSRVAALLPPPPPPAAPLPPTASSGSFASPNPPPWPTRWRRQPAFAGPIRR